MSNSTLWRTLSGFSKLIWSTLTRGEVALALAGRADAAVDGVAGAQAEAAHLRRADIDVVGAGQIVGFRTAQEAETVLKHFQRAGAEDLDAFFGAGLEDGEHHVLLAHGVRVFDVELFGESDEVGGRFLLQLLQRHPGETGNRRGAARLGSLLGLGGGLGRDGDFGHCCVGLDIENV